MVESVSICNTASTSYAYIAVSKSSPAKGKTEEG